MSEYIPKYPSKEGDDSNKTSSELLAETLKPIYVPQDLMLAWESHLASYSRDTNVLLDQVKDSELALNTQYQALLARVQKYEQMLQDITMDSNEFTMDTDEVNFTGWNILAQASYWDYLLRKEITKLSDQIKSTEYKGGLVTEVTDAVLVGLIADNTYISNVIGALSDTPLIRELDAALTSTVTSINDLQAESVRLAEKQAADAAAFADQQVEMLGQLITSIEASKAEQLNRLAEEAAIRTQLLQELEAKTDAITADYNAVADTLHTTVIQELTTMQDGISASVSELKTADEAIITSLDAYKVSNGQNIAALQNSVNVVTNTQESIATQVTGLIASFDQIDLGLSKAQADIITSNQARADGDAALSQQITTINTGLGDANSRIDTVNTAVSTLDTATATKFSELATTLAGVDDSIASVRQIADTAVSNDTAQATEINALKSRMTVTEGDVINKADASALNSLTTRVATEEGNSTSQGNQITKLTNDLATTNNKVNTKADATAVQTLDNKVTQQGTDISSQGASITKLTNDLATTNQALETKASVTALSALDTKVTNLGEDVVSQGSQVTQLTNTLATLDNKVSSKAESSALNTLDNKVSNIDGKVTANASSITALEGNISTIENGLATKADAEALTSLTTRVSNTEGGITSQGTRVTNLENSVNHETTGLNSKASSSALTSLDNKVTLVDDKVSVTNSSLLSLEGRVATSENGIASKLDASVIQQYRTAVDQDSVTAGELTQFKSALKIGGVNLFTGTKTFNNQSSENSTSSFYPSYGGFGGNTQEFLPNALFGTHTVVKTSSSRCGFYLREADGVSWEAKEDIVLSFWANASADVYVYGIASQLGLVATIPANQPMTKYEVVIPKGKPLRNASNQGIIEFDFPNGGELWYGAVMLQVGTKSTSWQPSSKDNEMDTSQFASATALENLTTNVSNIGGKVTTHASSIAQLQTDVGDHSSKLIVQGEAVNGLKASYVVKTDVNGLVAGYGLYNTGSTSAFGVNADYFYVGSTVNGKKPFMVLTESQSVDGITYPVGTWINSAIIADATIGSAHIANAAITNAKIASLDASKITTGYLDAARIQANSISADKIIVGDSVNLWCNQFFDALGVRPNNPRSGWYEQNLELKGRGVQMWGRDHIAPYSSRIPVKTGDKIVIEYTAGRNAGIDRPLSVGLWLYDDLGNTGTAPWDYGPAVVVANLGNDWYRWRRIHTVGSNGSSRGVAFGTLFFQIGQGENEGSPTYWTAGDVVVRKQIGGELIVNGAITADKINVTNLSAISANLGTIQVGTANIADLAVKAANIDNGAITTAKIGDLQVDTIKVKDNAVTNGIASQNTTSLTIVTEGGQVRINVGIIYYRRNGYTKFTDTLILYRDGIELKRWSFSGYWNGADNTWEVRLNQELPMVVDIVGVGTHTYSLSGLGTTSMALLEVKK